VPKPRPQKKHAKQDGEGKAARPGIHGAAPAATKTTRVLPMELQLGDRLTDETGEYEVIGRPYTTAAGKTAHVRVKRVESDVTMIRMWGAHERVAVRGARDSAPC
jgi:hypothetical protein